MVKEYEDIHRCRHQTGTILKEKGLWIRIENGFYKKVEECPYCGRMLK